jgi:hypothetical protein
MIWCAPNLLTSDIASRLLKKDLLIYIASDKLMKIIMKNIQFLKTILIIGLIASWALPEYGRSLFESQSHIEKFTVILFIFGIYLKWKYIEEFIFGFYLISLIFTLIVGFFYSTYGIDEKPGFLLHSIIFIIVIIPAFLFIRLRRQKIKIAQKNKTKTAAT